MLRFIKLFFALLALVGLIFIGAAFGIKSLDMALTGSAYTMLSILILSLINYAQA